MRASLIVTTYNRPDVLHLVLQSVLQQTVPPAEIIVADDGSGADTAETVGRFAKTSPIPVKHVWQEDQGFRAAQSRNRALAAAQGPYIVLIDGDMVLHPEFIADHLAVAREGRWIQGSRVLLTEAATAALLSSPLPVPFKPPFYSQGIMKKHAAIRCRSLMLLTALSAGSSMKSIKSCNMGFFLKDAAAVNGFDNRFVGWGREDSEFAARLYHSGLGRTNLKFGGLAYHLWHREEERASLPKNDLLLRQTLESRAVRCENGMKECCGKSE